MAADYKKLLIRHFDKALLLAFLAFSVYAAFKFVTTMPGAGEPPPRIPPKRFVDDPALHKERFVLRTFSNPQEPDATRDLTSDPRKIEPAPGEKQCPRCGWIVPVTTMTCPKPDCGYTWGERVQEKQCPRCGTSVPLTATTCPKCGYSWEKKVVVQVPKDVPLTVLSVTFKPVDILFKGFVKKVAMENNPIKPRDYDLQIHWGKGTQMSIVPLGEFFHGYELFPLEKRTEVYTPEGFAPYKKTIYYLTIKKPGGKPIVVEEGKTVQEDEPVATLEALEGKWLVQHRGETISKEKVQFEAYSGYMVREIGGKLRRYNVAQVVNNEVVLEDSRGKKYTLPVVPR